MSRVAKYLRFTVKLNAPAIVSTLSGDPKSSATQPFVPGGVMRGVLAGELLTSGVTAESDEFRRYILDGDVRFLHAYPSEGTGRSLPVPVPWRKEKGTSNRPLFDLARYSGDVQPNSFSFGENGDLDMDPVDIWPTASLQRADYAFIKSSGSTKRGVRIRTNARTHQQRDRDKGRSWKSTLPDGSEESHGGLFVYEFLEPDQSFQGMFQVWGDTADQADALIELIKNRLHDRQIFIGRSRRAGYGGAATISFGSVEQHELADGDVQQDISAGDLFRVQLLSSCIVRDSMTGQLDPAALPEQLRQRLGGKAVVQVERVLWDFETVGGFNRRWQLEVPQALAVNAGSVLVLKAHQAIPATTLRQIEHDGLGERRIEGFGRLVFFNDSDAMNVTVDASSTRQAQAAPPAGDPPELVRVLQRRLLDAEFSRSLVRQVRGIVADAKNPPTGSLLGRLRLPLRSGDPASGLQTLQQWLEGDDSQEPHKLKREARDKLRGCRLSNTTLFEWLRANATAQAGTQAVRSVSVKHANLLDASGEIAEAVGNEQGSTYAVRLIDTVLATLARQARQREREVSR